MSMYNINVLSNCKRVVRDLDSLTKLVEVAGNTFTDSSKDLLELAASDIMDSGVISSVRHIENLGPQQCEAYLQDRRISQATSIANTIKRNNLSLFSRSPVHEKSVSEE